MMRLLGTRAPVKERGRVVFRPVRRPDLWALAAVATT
jgi:hypothetical protein